MKLHTGSLGQVLHYWMLIIVVLLLVVLYQVKCLSCVRCSTIDDPIGCTSGNLKAKPCEGENDTMCVKYETVLPSGKKFAIRDCADNATSFGCKNTVLNEKTVQYCYIHCNTDGCNSAPVSTLGGSTAIVVLITAAYLFV